ncbi:MAG: glycoside hydrolase family 10 protein [Parabacteroides sp.]
MIRILYLFLGLSVFFCTNLWGTEKPEYPKQEIRAVWLTTIYGLDWPRHRASTERGRKEQQEELCQILDKLQEANFNTVFLQVRQRGDVIYRSSIEPVSPTFSGKYGILPGYDPLAFAIEECHKRGLECHAWFVTFPLGTDERVKEQGRLSPVRRHPKLCIHHNGEWYLDPGIPETSTYLLSLIKELVSNYDIDGIHFDYIRYPEQASAFPDKKSYRRYGQKKELASWRRENINQLVYRIYDTVKSLKPWVQVSSSPLGKYNRIPQVPNAGWTAYESVYQDPKQWLQQGKQDMIVPMMYYQDKNFYPFVDNWMEDNHDRLVVPGLGAYRMEKEESDWRLQDITDQIEYGRSYGVAGTTYFRCGNLIHNTKGILDTLRNTYYRYPAQLPPLTWLNNRKPSRPIAPKVEKEGADELKISWSKPADESEELTYTLYYSTKKRLDAQSARSLLATGIHDTVIYLPVPPDTEQGYLFQVSASTRYHMESELSHETYYYWSKFEK